LFKGIKYSQILCYLRISSPISSRGAKRELLCSSLPSAKDKNVNLFCMWQQSRHMQKSKTLKSKNYDMSLVRLPHPAALLYQTKEPRYTNRG
jgi:hypothetical protein